MKIGLDYDGVIADTGMLKSRWIKEHTGRDVPPGKTDRTNCAPLIGLKLYKEMSVWVYGREATRMAPPLPGVQLALRRLSKKHALYLITNRRSSQLTYAKAWLKTHHLLLFFSGFFSAKAMKKSKLDICREKHMDILIDDDRRHLHTAKKPRCIHFQQPPFSPSPGWKGVLHLIEHKQK